MLERFEKWELCPGFIEHFPTRVWKIAKRKREKERKRKENARRDDEANYYDRKEFHDLQIVRLSFRDLVPTFETPPRSTKVAASLEKTRNTCRTLSSSSSSSSLSHLGSISINSPRSNSRLSTEASLPAVCQTRLLPSASFEFSFSSKKHDKMRRILCSYYYYIGNVSND